MGVLDTINRLREKWRATPEGQQAAAKGLELNETLERLSAAQQRRAERDAQQSTSYRAVSAPTPELVEARDNARAGCMVPLRYRQSVTRTGQEAEAMSRIMAAIERRDGAIILLCGVPGAGKTSMACEAVLRACEIPLTGLYVRAMDLLQELQSTFDGKGKTTTEVVLKFARRGLLVVDEWHRRKQSEWAAAALWNVVDRRYADLRPTIIVSNGEPEQIAETFDGAMWDRINEDGGVIYCDWQSHREVV